MSNNADEEVKAQMMNSLVLLIIFLIVIGLFIWSITGVLILAFT